MLQYCKVCGGNLRIRFPEVGDPITGETFAIKKCTECGLGHTVPQPDDLSRYYGKVYYGNRHGFSAKYCIRRRLKFISFSRPESAGGRLLDVGCGDGSFLIAARDAGWNVAGVEINSDPAKAAGLDVYEKIEQISAAEPFDCITLWHSLEHMSDVKAALSQLSKLLKPEGILLIAVPDNGGVQSRVFRHRWIPLDVPRHLCHFNAESLRYCLDETGFSVRHCWHTELEYDLMGWAQSALNCIFSSPNIFLDQLSGKQRNVNRFVSILNWLTGSILTALALPLVVVETLLGRGGTIIISASRNKQLRPQSGKMAAV